MTKSAKDVLKSFDRWPTWMWANEEMIDLIEWMKEYNESGQNQTKVGFYGIDIYSLWESIG
ncbi:erythromycin esterase family protein [Peribacillus frigoritolerans]|nr:erythromycin esterase family protein [Peribacillus frigoritolerans]